MRHFPVHVEFLWKLKILKKQSKVFRTRFKMLIEAQLDLIQSDDWDVLLEYEIDAERLEMAADLDS